MAGYEGLDLFNKKGALDDAELNEFLACYRANGHYDYREVMHVGGMDKRTERLVGELAKGMSNAFDRLALTLERLSTENMVEEIR